MELRKLSDQTIVITGASSGIGLVTARKAAARGARLILASRSEDALSALNRELTDAGPQAAIGLADVADFADVQKIALLAKEKFGGFNPPPVYAPKIVADAILHCAEHPMRDVFVGGGGKGLSSMGQNAPRLTDRLMELMFFDLQRTDKPADQTTHRSLYEPSGFSNERGGYEGHVAESRIYTRANLHPRITGG